MTEAERLWALHKPMTAEQINMTPAQKAKGCAEVEAILADLKRRGLIK